MSRIINRETTVVITNKAQVAFFLKYGVKPIDIFLSHTDAIAFVFELNHTREVYELWKENVDTLKE